MWRAASRSSTLDHGQLAYQALRDFMIETGGTDSIFLEPSSDSLRFQESTRPSMQASEISVSEPPVAGFVRTAQGWLERAGSPPDFRIGLPGRHLRNQAVPILSFLTMIPILVYHATRGVIDVHLRLSLISPRCHVALTRRGHRPELRGLLR